MENIIVVLLGLVVVGLGVLLFVVSRRPRLDLTPVVSRLDVVERGQERLERTTRDEIAKNRGEVANTLKDISDTTLRTLSELAKLQHGQLGELTTRLGKLTDSNDQRFEALRQDLLLQLSKQQADNATALDKMRQTVDEKLHSTLEKRLTESFQLVSERLEQVYRGLGEMQTLASGVGDLKKVLSNVKTRGMWGEFQLGNLLEQILTPDQYSCNVATKLGSAERVEFAIKLPGGGDDPDDRVWLPIDAKFPQEEYQRLVDAAERGDTDAVADAGRKLEVQVKHAAQDIHTKYLDPPRTTDFALMFLPTESLYAEILRRPGLLEAVQTGQRVVIAGPTTLAALLNSLQMGFRTLAIQRRSSEVWAVLGAIKTEFGKFGALLEKVQKKIQETGNVMEQAARRTRVIERKLRQVEALPPAESVALLRESESSRQP